MHWKTHPCLPWRGDSSMHHMTSGRVSFDWETHPCFLDIRMTETDGAPPLFACLWWWDCSRSFDCLLCFCFQEMAIWHRTNSKDLSAGKGNNGGVRCAIGQKIQCPTATLCWTRWRLEYRETELLLQQKGEVIFTQQDVGHDYRYSFLGYLERKEYWNYSWCWCGKQRGTPYCYKDYTGEGSKKKEHNKLPIELPLSILSAQ